MNKRIKKLRKALDLTQQEFANKIGVKRNTVATYEMGRSEPSSSAISLICREFDVNENWLRNGEEPMFNRHSKKEELTNAINQFLKDESNSFKERLIAILLRLNESDWEVLEKIVIEMAKDELINSNNELSASAKPEEIPLYCRPSHKLTYEEIRQDAIDYFDERILEKNQAEKLPTSERQGYGLKGKRNTA